MSLVFFSLCVLPYNVVYKQTSIAVGDVKLTARRLVVDPFQHLSSFHPGPWSRAVHGDFVSDFFFRFSHYRPNCCYVHV